MVNPHGRSNLAEIWSYNLYIWAQIDIKWWNQTKLILQNPALNITHFAIADQQYSRVDTTFNAHCRVHYKEDVRVHFAHCNAKSVRYRTVLRAWHHVQECNVLELRRGSQCCAEIGDITNCVFLSEGKNGSLAWGNNGLPQPGVSLAYTINPLGPRAERVFITIFVVLPRTRTTYLHFATRELAWYLRFLAITSLVIVNLDQQNASMVESQSKVDI